MSDSDASDAVAVTSAHSLVTDAVAAALAGSDLTVIRLPWPGTRRDLQVGWSDDAPRPSLGVMICDLTPPVTHTARWLVGVYPTRWLLMTDTPKGALWGGMLEAGVVGVLSSTTSLAELLAAIATFRVSGTSRLPPERDELTAQWRLDEAERDSMAARMSSLTPREAEVLFQLRLGRSVREIAQLHGVAHSTVRSQVRSVLQKLGVSRQLAATALLDRWEGPREE
ncbi:LuxR C-terminal-related transcriptional regulator [Nocardioides sp. 503]|uniref:LuxR C-terminal-related transcriptional regulator n=1 Tax=Nocardioides sp. 503 TaxID=2508326 RepID=UPI00142F9BEE|nr:LuxR C-terminal-related transcriptional regulator [Nocardioides sp. 503]